MRLSTLAALAAATEIMKIAGCPIIGALVSYNVNVGNVERTVMRTALIDAGFPTIARAAIPVVTVEAGLRMAQSQLKPTTGFAVLRVAKPSEASPLELAVWKGNPDADSTGSAKPIMGGRVRVDQNGEARAYPPEGIQWPLREVGEGDNEWSAEEQATCECMNYANALAVRANRLARYVETSDVTTALQAVLTGMHAAKQCQHGRGHFLLARFVEPWTRLGEALRPYGVTFPMTSMWGLPDHIQAARETAEDSFGEKIRDLRTRLRDAADPKAPKGTRSDSLTARIQECVDLVSEARMFRDILGDAVAGIEADVSKVKIKFTALQGGVKVTYTAGDVDAPLSFGEAPAPVVGTVETPGEINGTKLEPGDRVVGAS